MVEEIGPVISALTLADLAALPCVPLIAGQHAFVAQTSQVFILRPATPGAANGINVLGTPDVAALQWIDSMVVNSNEQTFQAAVDLTVQAQTDLVPAIAGKTFVPNRWGGLVTSAAGVFSSAATIRIGNASRTSNILAATAAQYEATEFGSGAGAFLAGSVNSTAGNSPGTTLVQGEKVQFGVSVAAAGTGGFAWTIVAQLAGRYV